MNVAELLGLPDLESDLDRVDVALRAAVATEDVFLAEVGGHLVRAGGKRFRPALALAAGAVCGSGATDGVVLGGVACELMHLGSLYHDDVMDDADTRRGVPSANAKWGNLVAILAGDFLLGKASEIATDLGGEVSGVLARTLVRMCEGQVLELSTAFSVHRSEDQYLRSIAGKTAALMSAACRIGGLVGGATGEQADGLTAFGYAFGSTFQVYDDIADLVRTEEQLGKPAG
ncbi:MAG TPA: polyprenyl synthetase family protein, partial [Acidimicrobiales bacterium]|nr:polyprenyl synthetase family protein [Acidimicrobiales bacterium]